MAARAQLAADADPPESGALPPGSPLESSPSYYLHTLGAKVSVRVERNLRKALDLGFTEWRVLQLVGYEPGISPTRLTALTGLNKANISRAMAALEARGVLQRKAAPGHARHIQLFLTAEGRRIQKRGNEMRTHSEDALLAGLDPAARIQLCATLRRLLRNLDAMEEQG
jgi:DNA-binding MarR family transcriptional regulator